MAEKNEILSIRADESTKAKFKSVCAEFGSQAECVNALINAFELDKAKGMLSGLETNIKDFQSLANSLVRAYTNILELNLNSENRIRQEFEAQLESQSRTIIGLQEQLDIAKAESDNSEKRAVIAEEELDSRTIEFTEEIQALKEKLENSVKSAEKSEQALQDKKTIIENLTEELSRMSKSAELSEKAEQDRKTALSEKEQAEKRAAELEKQLKENEEKANQVLQIAKQLSEIELEKAVIEAEKKANNQIAELQKTVSAKSEEISELKVRLNKAEYEIEKLSQTSNKSNEKENSKNGS